MDIPDQFIICNRDWDPSYLSEILDGDFFEFSDLWESDVQDTELVMELEKVEKYSSIIEDISVEDEVLCRAVESIEEE